VTATVAAALVAFVFSLYDGAASVFVFTTPRCLVVGPKVTRLTVVRNVLALLAALVIGLNEFLSLSTLWLDRASDQLAEWVAHALFFTAPLFLIHRPNVIGVAVMFLLLSALVTALPFDLGLFLSRRAF